MGIVKSLIGILVNPRARPVKEAEVVTALTVIKTTGLVIKVKSLAVILTASLAAHEQIPQIAAGNTVISGAGFFIKLPGTSEIRLNTAALFIHYPKVAAALKGTQAASFLKIFPRLHVILGPPLSVQKKIPQIAAAQTVIKAAALFIVLSGLGDILGQPVPALVIIAQDNAALAVLEAAGLFIYADCAHEILFSACPFLKQMSKINAARAEVKSAGLLQIIPGLPVILRDAPAIIIEGEYFDQDNIRRSSRALNISTESSYRFSRDIDRSNVVNYACRVADLILKICGGELVSDCWVVGDIDNQRISIPFSVKKIDDLCGFEIPVDLSKSSLERLGFSIKENNAYEWDVTVPSHRHDITCQADIVSECLRMYGADKIPSHDVIGVGLHDCNDASFNFTKNVSKYFSDHGFLECYNLSLRDHAESDRFCGVGSSICPKNPLNSDQVSFRNTLIFGLLDTLRCNIQNGNFDNGFYEVGRVVTKIEGKFNECLSVAFIKTENQLQRSWAKEDVFTFFDAKSLIMPILRNFSKRIAPFSDVENSKMWQNGYSGTCGFLNREKFQATCGMLNVGLVKEFGIKEHVIAAEIILSLDIFKRKAEKIIYKE